MHSGAADRRADGRVVSACSRSHWTMRKRMRFPRRWSVAYSANLAGAVLASLAGALLLLLPDSWAARRYVAVPCDLHRSRCVCLPSRGPSCSGSSDIIYRDEQQEMATGIFLSADCLVLVRLRLLCARNHHLDPLWSARLCGGSIYAFSWMLTSVLIGLWAGSWVANHSKNLRPAKVFLVCAFALLTVAFGMAARASPCSSSLRCGSPPGFLHARAVPAAGRLYPDRSLSLLPRTDLSHSP